MDTNLAELAGRPGATIVMDYHGGGRVLARGAWVLGVPVSASGYKSPEVLGGADLRYHHCADQQRQGLLRVEYLDTDSMTSDALTKALPKDSHLRHRGVLLGHTKLAWSPNESPVAD